MRYIVAYIDFFDNELKLKEVKAQNEVEAINVALEENFSDCTLEDVKNMMFDRDSAVNVIEINLQCVVCDCKS